MRLPLLRRTLASGVLLLILLQAGALAHASGLGPHPMAGPNEWTDVNPAGAPSPRSGSAMAYDPVRNRIVLFGGENDRWQWLNDTWVYDVASNTWANVTPAASPPPMIEGPRMVYDSVADRVLLFGVAGIAQVWSYDPSGNTWALQWQGHGGVWRRSFSVAYDESADRSVLFGGGDWAPHFPGLGSNQTWLFDYAASAWARVNTSASPPSRFGSAMAYDSTRGRVLLFGGCSVPSTDFWCTPANDTWAFDAGSGTWTELLPATRPPPLDVMVYDSVSDRLVLHGGNETWTYDPAANLWTDQNPATVPPARSRHAMAYASAADRTVLFGGAGTSLLNDTWTYQYGAFLPGPPSATWGLGATAAREQVTLTWRAPASDGGYSISAYRIYRGVPPATPAFLIQVGNVLTYRDSGLTTLTTYAYQVSAVNNLGEGPRSNVAVATPPDVDSPSIAILQPEDNATLTSGAVTVVGTASDNIAVSKVEVSTDYVTWALANGTTSWSVNLTLPEGKSRIWALATDTSGNEWLAEINVTVVPVPRGTGTPDLLSAGERVLFAAPILILCVGAVSAWRRRARRTRGDDGL